MPIPVIAGILAALGGSGVAASGVGGASAAGGLGNIVASIQDALPKELLAQLKMPAQQDEFTAVVDEATESYFDVDRPIGVVKAQQQITGDFKTNVETKDQKDKRLANEAQSARLSSERGLKLGTGMPSIPRRYSGGS